MAKINRYSGNLESFASEADTNQRTTFGTTTLGDDTLDGNINSFYLTGWQIVGPNEKPTLQDFNAAFFTIGRLMAYVHQVGMPEWDGEQEYYAGSKVNRAGVEYICTTNNHVSVTPPESDAANWRLPASSDIGYDNTASGLTAENAQAAIDETAGATLSLNQAWQDLLASRSLLSTYTNTTSRPIIVVIGVPGSGAGSWLRIEITGPGGVATGFSNSTAEGINLSAVIPPGDSYRAVVTGSPVSLAKWFEYR